MVWFFAFGYFAAYVPYSVLVKALSSGRLGEDTFSGLSLLPWSAIASMVSMWITITILGWWKSAPTKTVLGRAFPWPGRLQAFAGLCTAAIIATTTLAYTFEGISIVFAMLLMRGGVLLIAPIVDVLTGRAVAWPSRIGLVLTLIALAVALKGDTGYALTGLAFLDIGAYLLAYFVRFRIMSHVAKSPDPQVNRSYFVQEQMIATPALVTLLIVGALLLPGAAGDALRTGFLTVPTSGAFLPILAIGLFSQGTGFFGSLIFLDARENAFCVPVNRASSLLAGAVAGFVLSGLYDFAAPTSRQLISAGIVTVAVVVLSIRPKQNVDGAGGTQEREIPKS